VVFVDATAGIVEGASYTETDDDATLQRKKVSGWVSKSLGSGGQLPAELRGRVCCFLSVCPSRYDARHRKPRRCVYALNLGERA